MKTPYPEFEVLRVMMHDQLFTIGTEVIHVDGNYTCVIKKFCLSNNGKIWFFYEDDLKGVKDLVNFRRSSNRGIPIRWMTPEGIIEEFQLTEEEKQIIRSVANGEKK